MPEFKLIRKVIIFEEAIIEAESKEAALAKYDEGNVEGWEEQDCGQSEEIGLTSINERGQHGWFSVCFPVEEGKFV